MASKINLKWPQDWVEWIAATSHRERKQLFNALSDEIDKLVAVSIRDRDDESPKSVDDSLNDTGHANSSPNFYCKKWRRRHIESYLIWPNALAKSSGISISEIENTLKDVFGLAIGSSYKDTNPPAAFIDIRGKDILSHFKINPNDIVPHMDPDEIPVDLKKMVEELVRLAK